LFARAIKPLFLRVSPRLLRWTFPPGKGGVSIQDERATASKRVSRIVGFLANLKKQQLELIRVRKRIESSLYGGGVRR
jgi:hypothetical protein